MLCCVYMCVWEGGYVSLVEVSQKGFQAVREGFGGKALGGASGSRERQFCD